MQPIAMFFKKHKLLKFQTQSLLKTNISDSFFTIQTPFIQKKQRPRTYSNYLNEILKKY